MGAGLLQLAVAAAFVTGTVLFIAEQSQPDLLGCPSPTPSWRHQAALAASAPGLGPAEGPVDAAAASMVTGVAADVMRRVGWRVGTQFARFDSAAKLEKVLRQPWSYPGAFLLITPGNGTVGRRLEHEPFLSIHPAAAPGLAAVLGPAAAALNAAAGAMESALGRRLFAFQLETAPLPACAAGTGPCAVWEASSRRVVLDAGLAGRMAGLGGGGSGRKPAGTVLSRGALAAQPADGHASMRSSAGADGGPAAAGGAAGLPSLLAEFAAKLADMAGGAADAMQSGQGSLPALAASFATAAPAALLLAMAGPPLWWCITCPLVLGMLAPWVFNLGLTAAAEALCAQLQLPDDSCADLWWSAFALALMLSLGSAIPIVYVCNLPQCARRGRAAAAGAAAAAAGTAVARLVAS